MLAFSVFLQHTNLDLPWGPLHLLLPLPPQLYFCFSYDLLMWTILKVFIEFVTTFCFMLCHKACGIFVPWPGMEPIPPALKGEVLTIRLPGKSCPYLYLAGSFKPAWGCLIWSHPNLRSNSLLQETFLSTQSAATPSSLILFLFSSCTTIWIYLGHLFVCLHFLLPSTTLVRIKLHESKSLVHLAPFCFLSTVSHAICD